MEELHLFNMISELLLALTFFIIVGLVIIVIITMLYWWWKARRIKRKSPDFSGEFNDFTTLNYDKETVERRLMQKERNGNERRIRPTQEGIGISQEQRDESEIRRVRAEIEKLRRETGN